MQRGELAEQGDECAFAEGVGQGGVEGEGGVGFGEVADPVGLVIFRQLDLLL